MNEQLLTQDLEGAMLRDLMLDRICNSFERISEQLSILHAELNAPQIEGAEYVN